MKILSVAFKIMIQKCIFVMKFPAHQWQEIDQRQMYMEINSYIKQ